MKNARDARTAALVAAAIVLVGLVGLSTVAAGDVEFTGEVELTGDSATDGSTFSYELDDEDEVDDLAVDVTGTTVSDEQSVSTTADSGTLDLTTGGTTGVEGQLTLVGYEDNREMTDSFDGDASIEVSGEDSVTLDITPDWFHTVKPDGLDDSEFDDSARNLPDPDTNRIHKAVDEGVGSGSTTRTLEIDVDVSELDIVDSVYIHQNIQTTGDNEARLEMPDGETYSRPDDGELTYDEPNYDVSDQNQITLTFEQDGSVSSDRWFANVEVSGDNDEMESVSVDGDTQDVEANSTTTFEDVGPGLVSIDIDAKDPTSSVEWVETHYPTNPSIEIDGDTLSHTGDLEPGETETRSVDLDPETDYSAEINSDGLVEASVEWVEVTETVDPSISVNGQTADHSGTLDDGETVSLDVDESWIDSGTNEVEVGVDDPDEGPVGQVDLDYSHSTTGDAHSSSTDSTEWSEDRVVERTFSEDREDVEIEIPLDDRVVDVQSVDVWIDGTETVVDYNLNGTDFTADIGHVEEGEDVEVAVDAYKVSVSGGDIEIINATPEGETMATEFEIYPDGDGEFGVEVSGTVWGDRLHEFEEVGWDDDGTYVEVASDGDQVLRTPNAQSGSEASVGVTDLSVDPNAGVVEADPLGGTGEPGDDDFAHQRVELEFDGASDVEVGYHDTVSGEVYGLERVSDDVEVDTAQASSPVYLTAYESDTYQIVPSEFESAIGAGTPQEQDDSLPGPTWLWLIVGVGGATALVVDVLTPGGRFTAGVARRVWGVVTSVVSLIPFVDIGSSSRGRSRQQSSGVTDATPSRGVLAVAAVGLSAIGLLAAELVTPRSVFFDLPAMVLSGAITGVTTTVAGSAFMPVLTGVGALLALWAFDVTTDTPMARWVQVVAVSTVVVYVVESIQPGTLLGPLSEAVETTLPLLILGGVFVLWRWSNNRGDTTEVTIDSDD